METYWEEHGAIMNVRVPRHLFAQIIGEHAIRLVELTQADRTSQSPKEVKKRLMAIWAHIAKLNDEWHGLVTVKEKKGSEFDVIARKIVHGYSEALGDYIIDRASVHAPEWGKKIANIASLEGNFYAALAPDNAQDRAITKRHWIAYTQSIVRMVNALDQKGGKHQAFWHAAANTVRTGRLLGTWLDGTVL
jgi:hypothetical protein